MDSQNKDASEKLLPRLKAREMSLLWLVIILVLLLPAANFFFPQNRLFTDTVISLLLVIAIFWSSSKLIVSNSEVNKIAERLQGVVANLSDGFIYYDANFRILSMNVSAERIFGVKSEEIIGEHFGPEKAQNPKFRLLTQTIFPSLAPLVLKRSEGDSFPQIVDISFDEPEAYFRVTTIRIGSNNNNGEFVKIIHDRTREIQLYRSKSEFITIAAHQLRTPLTAINWAFETMNKDYSSSPPSREMLENGLGASIKVLKIVNDLLDVSKIEEGRFGYKFENVSIVEFIAGIMENANIVAKQYNVNLYFDRGNDSSIVVSVDPDKLGLALSNLVDNAIKYNTKNGDVKVKLEKLSDKPYIQISIEDTGIGIPPAAMEKVFTKFFRADNALKFRPEGSGLGIYISKNIIARHGGAIWAESTLGRGTTFYITLPTDPNLIPSKEVAYGDY